MTIVRAFFFVLCVSASAMAQFIPPTQEPGEPRPSVNPDGAKAALALIPAKYGDGILKLSADDGTPNPPAWYILAKKTEGEIYSITISKGQITEEKRSLNLRALLGNPVAIDLSKVTIGSNGAFEIAGGYCAKKGRKLGSVSYALQQKGPDAAPVWAIWCYSEDGSSIGYLEILATTGDVVSSE